MVVITEATSTDIGAYGLHLFLLNHIFARIFIDNKLFDVWSMQLMPLILTLNLKTRSSNIHGLINSPTESGYCLIEPNFILILVAKINIGDLFKIVNKRKRFWRHHLLVTRGELKPWISQDVFCARSLIRILVKYFQKKLFSLPWYMIS